MGLIYVTVYKATQGTDPGTGEYNKHINIILHHMSGIIISIKNIVNS